MPYSLTKFQRTYKASEPLAQYFGVVQDGEGKCKLPTTDNAIPLGILSNEEQPREGKNIAVMLDGIGIIKAGGPITAGSEVVLKAGGTIVAASTLAAGTQANILGIAETSGILDDLISVRIEKKVRTV